MRCGRGRWAGTLAFQALVIVLLSYPLFYNAYKFYVPDLGGADFYQYYPMYLDPLSLENAKAPFVYRKLHALVTHAIHEAGIHYETRTALADPGISQRVFFAALLSNHIALLTAVLFVALTVQAMHRWRAPVLSTAAGLLLFLSFHVHFTVLTPISDGWGLALAAVGLFALTTRRLWLLAAVFALAVFQRELLPAVFLAVCLGRLAIGERPRAILGWGALLAGLAAVLYLLLRTVLLPVEGYGHQVDPAAMLDALLGPRLTSEVLFQGFLSQNLIMLALALVLLRLGTGPRLDRRSGVLLMDIAMVVAVVVPASFATQIGSAVGRMLLLAQPFACVLIGCLAVELAARRAGEGGGSVSDEPPRPKASSGSG